MQTSEKKKVAKMSRSVLKGLLTYVYPYKVMMLGVLVSLCVTSGAVLGISESIKIFINDGIAEHSISSLNRALLTLLVTVLVLAVFTFARFSLITLVGEKVVSDMRTDIFKQVLKLSPSYFERNNSGELLSRLVADTTLLLSIIGSTLSFAMRNWVMLMGGIIMLIGINPRLASMLLLVIPAVIVPLLLVRKKLRFYAKTSQDKVADLTSHTDQILGALKVVQAYQRESFELSRFVSLIDEQMRYAKDRIRLRGALTGGLIFLAFAGIGIILWTGGMQVLNGELSPGDLSAFIYVAIVCAGSVAGLSDVLGEIQKAVGATARIFDFLDIESEIKEIEHPMKVDVSIVPTIEFRDVTFSYLKNETPRKSLVLDSVSFQILQNKINALVGKSGAGKSTIFSLLERFYDIDSGSILINGVDVRQLGLGNLRSLFTYVSQDSYIFSTTVYDNIAYGNPEASEEEVLSAARQAGCMEFIQKMENGIYTHLGDKGIKLSGGQKQRISIARAILNNPKVLLLDEATSSLDAENESIVQSSLKQLMEGRTTIVIAHRLSTIKDADQIIVLESGKVKEIGTHGELLQKSSLYKKLAQIQNI